MAITNLILLAATAATAPLAAAADKQEGVLFVYLHDRHLVDSTTLAGAKPIVARMFAEIGVRVEWRTGDPRPQLEQGCGRRSVAVRFAALQHPNVDATVLAFALPYTAGVQITVLLDQLSPLSRSKPIHARALLAHVLVHEISHVLQGINRHSESGVMRALWSDDEQNQMVERPLPFTPDDVELIHCGMGESGPAVADTCSVPHSSLESLSHGGSGIRYRFRCEEMRWNRSVGSALSSRR
jgi:hypothetical protein